ncbi:transposase [Pediococcus acidilactici]|uniref:transposase n=1 Tax=Pediococcus acidilactici TaxID=1254 RepID=UPI0034A0008D
MSSLYSLVTDLNGVNHPHDFPNRQTVYGYFRRWSEPINVEGHSQLDLILKRFSIKANYTWAVRHPLHSSF